MKSPKFIHLKTQYPPTIKTTNFLVEIARRLSIMSNFDSPKAMELKQGLSISLRTPSRSTASPSLSMRTLIRLLHQSNPSTTSPAANPLVIPPQQFHLHLRHPHQPLPQPLHLPRPSLISSSTTAILSSTSPAGVDLGDRPTTPLFPLVVLSLNPRQHPLPAHLIIQLMNYSSTNSFW